MAVAVVLASGGVRVGEEKIAVDKLPKAVADKTTYEVQVAPDGKIKAVEEKKHEKK